MKVNMCVLVSSTLSCSLADALLRASQRRVHSYSCQCKNPIFFDEQVQLDFLNCFMSNILCQFNTEYMLIYYTQ